MESSKYLLSHKVIGFDTEGENLNLIQISAGNKIFLYDYNRLKGSQILEELMKNIFESDTIIKVIHF